MSCSRYVTPLSVAIIATGAALGSALAGPSALAAEPVAQSCAAPTGLARFARPLARVGQRIALHEPITVVAFGSSSTAGAGASSSAASYPSRLEVELKTRFPTLSVSVLNRGVNGDEIAGMLARLDAGVVAEKPDLVLWQVGTNSVLRDRDLAPHAPLLRDGIAQLRAAGADVILIDPQFAPKVLAKPEAEHMVELIATAAKLYNVDLFHRFEVMRYWRDVKGIAFEDFLSPDGLHMNDWSYDCVAKLLAAEIAEAATRIPVTASAPAQRP